MNQNKIGAFISERRRAKGWTQNDLAEKLGITDKAVSKWETGRSLPDLSLFVPLCDLLDITLNELFAGECIPEEDLKERTDAVLLEVITNWLGHDGGKTSENDTTSQTVLEVQNVSKIYKSESNSVLAVNNVSFQIPYSSFVGIMGASGSGKTTLLNLIATIDKPTNGTIKINGQTITDIPEAETADFRREHLGFVFQEYNLLDTLTIYENIALALTIKEVPKESIGPTIQNLSEKLAISSILDKFPYEVSGGQRQRCACARAIAASPDIILADEPTGALDSNAAKQLLNTFSTLCSEYHATILMVTHDVMAASYCDRLYFMRDGEIKASLHREQENKQAFFAKILEKMAWIG
ncbi:MAG: ATP-binding cassette domain-containing protein [Lachnospiraceae bacterium]|nr:ATP-binding cassette domain-containing protein [Lachnospiraceae bacterium]